ncbi:MAG: ATP-binding protein, partial [Bacteroidota bacterium]
TLVEEDGAVVGVQAVARDVTERRAVMKALVEAREIAERSSTARQRFLANMSHEMRTPLNGVIGTAELLARTRLDADQRKLLDALQFAADALLALINDILDLTKIDSGKISFERVPFRLGDALHGFADTVRFRAAEKGIRLDLDLHPALPEAVVGDPMRLGQILLNLLSNAVKFTAEGGVRLGVRPGAPGGPLRFVVEDTGIGIAPERLDHVFDRFTQARSDTTRQFGGTGLGLAIVRELAERMGGAVRIESAEGVGTRIEVDLPLDEAPADAVLPDVAVGAEADLTGVRVLLVEDNPLNQFVASEMLEDWGAIVSTAGNGREAVEAVGDGAAPPFDVVLMDVQMPEMDGFEATRRIRARFGPEVLPVVALTASALVEQRAAMQEAGMDDLVVKPFKPAHLRARVAAHVRQAETSEPPAAASVPATPLADAPESDAPESDVPEANASEAAFDDSVLDETFLDEQAGGDPAFRRRMLELFLDPLPETLAALESAAAADDRPAVQAAAHRLKGGAGIIGAHALYEAATALEAAARSEAEAPLGPPVAALAAAAEPAAAAARALLTLAPCSP